MMKLIFGILLFKSPLSITAKRNRDNNCENLQSSLYGSHQGKCFMVCFIPKGPEDAGVSEGFAGPESFENFLRAILLGIGRLRTGVAGLA